VALNAAAARAPAWFDAALDLGTDERASLGTTLVVTPHADDESLGCGGLVALLAEAGQEVWIVLLTDGAGSHQGSRTHDAKARRNLREEELIAAVGCLGVPAERVLPMRLPDGDVPHVGDARFEPCADVLRALIETTGAGALLVPWRRDPHPDHRAAWALVERAVERLAERQGALHASSLRVLEYLVWALERGTPEEVPRQGEVRVWRADIRRVQSHKRHAIAAHRSQAGLVITDDPHGFALSLEMRERAATPHEYFLEEFRPA